MEKKDQKTPQFTREQMISMIEEILNKPINRSLTRRFREIYPECPGLSPRARYFVHVPQDSHYHQHRPHPTLKNINKY